MNEGRERERESAGIIEGVMEGVEEDITGSRGVGRVPERLLRLPRQRKQPALAEKIYKMPETSTNLILYKIWRIVKEKSAQNGEVSLTELESYIFCHLSVYIIIQQSKTCLLVLLTVYIYFLNININTFARFINSLWMPIYKGKI